MEYNRFVPSAADAALTNRLTGNANGNPFTIAALSAVCFSNDMKHIHLHANDEDFDKTHNLAGDYYDHMGEESDYLCELALEFRKPVPNLSTAATVINWAPESDTTYSYNHALNAIMTALIKYEDTLHALRGLPELSTDIQSWLDDTTRYWEKERQYRLARRLGEG